MRAGGCSEAAGAGDYHTIASLGLLATAMGDCHGGCDARHAPRLRSLGNAGRWSYSCPRNCADAIVTRLFRAQSFYFRPLRQRSCARICESNITLSVGHPGRRQGGKRIAEWCRLSYRYRSSCERRWSLQEPAVAPASVQWGSV